MTLKIEQVSIDELVNSDTNPRFELSALNELADSIKGIGILQPLIVRKTKLNGGKYEIIAGHRRAAAANIAGLKKVPAVVRSDKGDITLHHLVENIQREDLTPAETGMAVHRSITKKVKQKDVAKSLGKSEAWVSKFNTIGKAINLIGQKDPPDNRMVKLVDETDADKCYEFAREVLGLKPEGEVKKKATAGDGDSQQEMNLGDATPGELIRELFSRSQAEGKMDSYRRVTGSKELVIELYFKSDTEAKKFFGFGL